MPRLLTLIPASALIATAVTAAAFCMADARPATAQPAAAQSAAAAGPGQLRSLLIGVNDYIEMPLRGAVNDAQLLTRSISPLSVETVTLLDEDATRARILSEWRRLIAASASGDTVFVSFSGHGTQVPEVRRGTERDGRDEVFLTWDFKRGGVGTDSGLIRDDEVDSLTEEADRRGVRLIFLADSCHSGTLTRSAAAPAGATRQFPANAVGGWGNVQPIGAPATTVFEERRNVLFLPAALESEVVREVWIGDQQHGGMSVAVSRVLTGAGDTDGDGRITLAELHQYVLPATKAFARGQQNPDVRAGFGRDETVFVLRRAAIDTSPVVDHLRLYVDGGQGAPARSTIATALTDAGLSVRLVDSAADANLVWRPNEGRVILDGDVVAFDAPTVRELTSAIARESLVGSLMALLSQQPLAVHVADPAVRDPAESLVAGQRTRAAGDRIELRVPAFNEPYSLVFNISALNTIQEFAPHRQYTRIRPPQAGREWRQLTEVTPPFGAETVVVVASTVPVDGLVRQVQLAADGAPPKALVDALAERIKAGTARIGIARLYSAPRT